MLTGAAIGSVVPDPIWSSTLALASHYTLDHLPHWHYLLKYRSKIEDLSKVAIEPLISFPVLLGLAWYFKWDAQIIIPALVAALPDVIELFQLFIKSKLLDYHTRFHEFGHRQARPKDSLPVFISLLTLLSFVLLVTS